MVSVMRVYQAGILLAALCSLCSHAISKQALCESRCRAGKGGNLCNCYSVHFAGKRQDAVGLRRGALGQGFLDRQDAETARMLWGESRPRVGDLASGSHFPPMDDAAGGRAPLGVQGGAYREPRAQGSRGLRRRLLQMLRHFSRRRQRQQFEQKAGEDWRELLQREG